MIRKSLPALAVIAGLTAAACTSSSPTDVNPNGPGYARKWENEDKTVCFWVSDDRLQVVPEPNCDDASFTATTLTGSYSGGESCEITFRYTEPIPISNSRFSVTDFEPDPEGSTYSFEVVFSSSTAAGVVTDLNRYGVTCTASFEAVAYLSTITG